MSKYEWKPGTVAVATVRGVPNVFVTPRDSGLWYSLTPVEERSIHVPDDEVTDVRPLVVLDLAEVGEGCNGESPSASRIVRALMDTCSVIACDIANQIEAQTRPPKPAEPGKYGAVIAGDGREWFRYTTSEQQGRDWCRPGTNGGTEYARWDDLNVLRVTNEGVTA